ncbi:MarR family transcriptional regulator [Gracilibacillus halophilus YIM-C55.5]|uniref:MarR family transcriptional regulator n=1 Tax=Gracilibacillus halophilus YIM-C55.5 TaxID=1308866 RepID=N4WF70_9BACI|nr:MarR family transcriptional regulator [Gracilibacillus halophilus]ENH97919.1 MarR family transcriptional regulator [Gracilibacillus halophilus YIM-C55.5]
MDVSNLFHLYNQKARLLSKALNETLETFGLYASQWTILYTLYHKGPMIQTDIWRYLQVEAPTVTRTLTRMEKAGWVIRRDGTDKREKVIELTNQAIHKYPEIKEAIRSKENQFISALSNQELDQLRNILEKLYIEGE